MHVFIEKENKKLSLKFSSTVKVLLKKLKINPESVIVSRNNELVTEEVVLKDSDTIKIMSVVSGG